MLFSRFVVVVVVVVVVFICNALEVEANCVSSSNVSVIVCPSKWVLNMHMILTCCTIFWSTGTRKSALRGAYTPGWCVKDFDL